MSSFNSINVAKLPIADAEELKEMLRDFEDLQGTSLVGKFFYNQQRNRLIGVKNLYASEVSYKADENIATKAIRITYQEAWQEARTDAIEAGYTDKIWNEEDYLQVPCGEVVQIKEFNSSDEYFEVWIEGAWINSHPEAEALIARRFNLEGTDFNFICL